MEIGCNASYAIENVWSKMVTGVFAAIVKTAMGPITPLSMASLLRCKSIPLKRNPATTCGQGLGFSAPALQVAIIVANFATTGIFPNAA